MSRDSSARKYNKKDKSGKGICTNTLHLFKIFAVKIASN